MQFLNRGELIWVTRYTPQVNELEDKHPAVVVSQTTYNKATKMAQICSITSVARGNMFEVPIPDNCGIGGVIKVDCISTIDFSARTFSVAGKLPPSVLDDLLEKLYALLFT
jgi:mRNA interferase MazF